MADTFNKKEREKKKARKKKEKAERKELRKEQGKQTEVIAYVDYDGNFTDKKTERFESDLDPSEILTSVPKAKDDGSKTGRVKFFNEEKKFGFIKAGGKIGDIYFSIQDSSVAPQAGDKVEFQVGESENGPYAFDIKVV